MKIPPVAPVDLDAICITMPERYGIALWGNIDRDRTDIEVCAFTHAGIEWVLTGEYMLTGRGHALPFKIPRDSHFSSPADLVIARAFIQRPAPIICEDVDGLELLGRWIDQGDGEVEQVFQVTRTPSGGVTYKTLSLTGGAVRGGRVSVLTRDTERALGLPLVEGQP